jgi:hypothetical protein
MGLEIKFFWDGKCDPDLIHIGITDGCQVNVEEEWRKLTPAQRYVFSSNVDPPDQTYLFYRSLWLTESFVFRVSDKLEMHCPTCGKDYVLPESDYRELKTAFIEQKLEERDGKNTI